MKTRALAAGLVVCLCLIFSTSLFAQNDAKSTVTSIEKSLWEAWKNGKTEPFKEHLTDDTVSVHSHGVSTGKAQVIKEMTDQPCQVRNFSFSDWQVHELSTDAVLVTYKATQDATCQGNKVPAEVVASSVYIKKGGKWLAASHQETPAMGAATAKTE